MAAQIPTLHVGQGTYAGGLTLFPVWLSADANRMVGVGVSESVVVEEREGSPVVGELVVQNRGPRPVALLEGDLLEGGWQDRALVADVILAPQERRVVEVCCVEQGRWSGGATHRGTHRRVAPSVLGATRADRDGARQSRVWTRVDRYAPAVGASATGAMRDHLEAVRSDAGLEQFRPVDGQRGIVIGICGTPIALELFDSHATLLERWDAVVTASALDARLGPRVRTTGAAARHLARRVQRTDLRWSRESLGHRALSDRPGLSVRGLGAGGAWLHLTALATGHPLLVGA